MFTKYLIWPWSVVMIPELPEEPGVKVHESPTVTVLVVSGEHDPPFPSPSHAEIRAPVAHPVATVMVTGGDQECVV